MIIESFDLMDYECDIDSDLDCYSSDMGSDETTMSANIAQPPAALGFRALPYSGGVRHDFKDKSVFLRDYIRDYCDKYPKRCRNILP